MSTIALPHPETTSVRAAHPRRRLIIQLLLLILAVLLLWGYVVYRRDVGEASRNALAGSQVLNTPCGTIEYAEAGAGAPVLVLHGAGGGWDQGIATARGLVGRGYRIIAPSRFGYLRTPLPADASPAAEADTWACFLDELGIKRAAVIGMSAGASPATAMALRHPDRVSALVLLVPAAGGLSPAITQGPSELVMKTVLHFDLPFWAAKKIAPSTMLDVVAVPAALVPTLAEEDRAILNATIERIFPVSQRRRGIMNDGRTQTSGQLFPIHNIAVPTLLISAADDLYKTLPNAKHAARLIPDAKLLSFETGGHLLLGHDQEVWPTVADFIRAK